MIKKKSKSKKTVKKAAKKQTAKTSKKELRPAEVRQDIAAMVEAEAGELAEAVIKEGKKGQLSTVKYLFEVAHIYPQALEEEQPTAGEESLAKTLLDRLNIPDEPVIHDMYEKGEDIVVIPARPAPKVDSEKDIQEADAVVLGAE
jgi:hypothetical protein